MQLHDLIRHITGLLAEAAVDSPRLSADLLVAHALGMERQDLLKDLLLRPEREISGEALGAVEGLARRRAQGEPAAYILGVKEFYGREFRVSPDVLIPRPETELLIDTALDLCGRGQGEGTGESSVAVRDMGSLRAGAEEIARARQGSRTASPCFADFGTGSGCIAVTLALELPGWQGVALDKSPAALEMARENAQRLGADHLEFLLADFARPPLPEKSLDLLVSNPPYVSEREYADLDREVRAFEPKSALVPALDGPDRAPGTLPGTKEASGLEDIKTVILQAERLLKIGGILLIEMGSGQGEAGQALFDRSRWERVEVRPDLAGLPRLLVAKKHSRTSIYKN